MKKISLLPLLLILCLTFGCEKAIIDEDDDTNKKSDTEVNDTTKSGNKDDGGTTDDGDSKGGNDNDKDKSGKEITVTDFLTKEYSYQVWVTGYIVGACASNISNAEFAPPFTWSSAMLLADNPNETSPDKVISIELKSGSKARKELNLVDNPDNWKKKIKIFGYQNTYLSIPGIKKWGSNYKWVE